MSSKLNFSLTQLEYVLAVRRLGHFAKAANFCNVTQPTLSMQIQKLEETLGVTIFDRSKKPILLTDAGSSIIEQIQLVVSEAKKIGSLIEMRGKPGTRGTLVFGVIPTIAPYVLPILLPVLEKKYGGLELQIKEMQTHQIVHALQTDEIDVGLLAIPLKEPKIKEHSIYLEPFAVLCGKHHALAGHKRIKYSNLKSDDIWLLEEGHCLRTQVLDVCAMKSEKAQKRKFKFESGSLETLKKLIDSCGGYTLLPYLASERLGKNSVLVEFERPIPAREVGLVYRREHYKIELIQALGEAIREAIPEDLRKIRSKDLDVLPVQS